MKHTMLTKTDAVVIPAGITAPVWVSNATTWLGLFIAVFTLIYTIFKVIDAWYHWMHRWEVRKHKMKEEKEKSNKT